MPNSVLLKALLRPLFTVYVFLYRLTGGSVGGRVQGLRVLLLTTTGRKSGKRRTVALGYLPHGGGYVVIGSNAGLSSHPAWFNNLRSQPRVTVQINSRKLDRTAEVVGSDERARLWTQVVALAPRYGSYAKKTSREVPLVILRPQA